MPPHCDGLRRRIGSVPFFFIVLVVVFSVSVLPLLGLGKVSTSVVVPMGFLYFFLNDALSSKKILVTKYQILLLLFFVWGCVVSILAEDFSIVVSTQKKIFLTMIFGYVIVSFARRSLSHIRVLFLLNVINALIIFLSAISSGNVGIGEMDRSSYDVGANTFGYLAFCCLFSSFGLLVSGTTNKKMWVVYVLCAIFSVYMQLISASRAGFLLNVVISIMLPVIWLTKDYSFGLKALFKIAVYLVFVSFVTYLAVLPKIKNSYLFERIESLEERESPRTLHIYEALRIGNENPFFGVGAGHYAVQPRWFEPGNFSHNTYTEAFANYGAMGLLLYVLFVSEFIYSIYIKRSSHNRLYARLSMFFVLMFSAYAIFYVTYLTVYFMGVWFLFRAFWQYVNDKGAQVK